MASIFAGLYTVPDCQPEMMFCTPWAVASCPESGIGFSFFALSAVTTAFASPSLAAATASILLPVWTSICSKIVRAFWLSHCGHALVRALRGLAALDERIEDRSRSRS